MKTLIQALAFCSAVFMIGIGSAVIFMVVGLQSFIEAFEIFPVPIGLLSIPFYLIGSPLLCLYWSRKSNGQQWSVLKMATFVIPTGLLGGLLLATLIISGAWVT